MTIDRTETYYERSAAVRAADPADYLWRIIRGQQVIERLDREWRYAREQMADAEPSTDD
jgi:hypothetical protein